MFHDVLNKKRNYFRVKRLQLFRRPKIAFFQGENFLLLFLGENEPRKNVSFCSR